MRILHFLWILLFPKILFSQSSNWKLFGVNDGLSQGMIYATIQDKEGFVWIGTKNGLNRFDGTNFTVFQPDKNNDYALPSNNVTALFQDSKNRLWVGTINGVIAWFDSKHQRFYQYKLKSTNNKGLNVDNHIAAIGEDGNGDLWIGTIRGNVFKLKLSSHLKNGGYPNKSNLSSDITQTNPQYLQNKSNRIYNFYLARNHEMWICGGDGIYSLDYNKNTISTLKKTKEFEESMQISSVYEEKNGTLIFLNKIELLRYKDGNLTVIPIDKNIIVFNIDKEGYVIYSFRDDHIYRSHYSQLSHVNKLQNYIFSRPVNSFLTAVHVDRQKNIWVGTSGFGIIKYNQQALKFKFYASPYSVWNIFDNSAQGLMIWQYDRIYQIDRVNNVAKEINKLESNSIIIEDRLGNQWRVFNNRSDIQKKIYLELNNLKTNRRQLFDLKQSSDVAYIKLLEDAAGNIIIAGINSNLIRFNTTNHKFEYFDYSSLINLNEGVQTLYEDFSKNIWVSTQNGLIKAIPQKDQYKFTLYDYQKENPNSIKENFITSVLDDPLNPEEYLYIGTHGSGLCKMNKRKSTFEYFTNANGLIDNSVLGILYDDAGNLWISTYKGISRFNLSNETFTNFTSKDGLQAGEFNLSSFYKNGKGELMFGGVLGLSVFNPKDFESDQGEEAIKLIELKINNEIIVPLDESGILSQSIENSNEIILNHDQNNISISFTLLDFLDPHKYSFKYRIKEISKNWIELGATKNVNFSSLPSGDYHLELVKSTDKPDLNHSPLSLHIVVKPPWYKTWWSFIVFSGILALIFYRLYLLRINQLLLKENVRFNQFEKDRLEDMNKIKTNFFTSISHEFRTPLTLILTPLEELISEFPGKIIFKTMKNNAERLLLLVNQLLDLSKLEAGQMKGSFQNVDLVIFFNALFSSFEFLASRKKINLSISQSHTSLIAKLDTDKVDKIFFNLVSNAIKFTGESGWVKVELNYDETFNLIYLTVSDNGKGIEKIELDKIFNQFYQVSSNEIGVDNGTGIGLALVKELVHFLQGEIVVKSNPGEGTSFIISLPLIKAQSGEKVEYLPLEEPAYLDEEAAKPMPVTNENRLLLVDDNLNIRRYVRSIFEKKYEILEADNGLNGLRMAQEFTPDIIISDVMMPELDGFEFTKILKSNLATSHIPIILLTAKASEPDRLAGLSLGVDDYILKPFGFEEIQIKVKNLLIKQEKLRLYFSNNGNVQSVSMANPLDVAFIERANEILETNYKNSRFAAADFAEALNLSQSQCLRKLKALTGLTLNDFIRNYRLQKAKDYLHTTELSISEIALEVGFENMSYFAKVFQREFGALPSSFR